MSISNIPHKTKPIDIKNDLVWQQSHRLKERFFPRKDDFLFKENDTYKEYENRSFYEWNDFSIEGTIYITKNDSLAKVILMLAKPLTHDSFHFLCGKFGKNVQSYRESEKLSTQDSFFVHHYVWNRDKTQILFNNYYLGEDKEKLASFSKICIMSR